MVRSNPPHLGSPLALALQHRFMSATVQAQPDLFWKPFPKQARFMSCPAKEVCFGGAAGPGKSDSLLVYALWCMQFPNTKVLILRRKLVDLERSLIMRSHELYKGRGSWNGKWYRWTFPNNCFIEFGHVQMLSDLQNYQSAQYQVIMFDELTHFMEEMYTYFFTRLRTVHPHFAPRMRSATNPGSIGHGWVMKRFWINDEKREPNKIYKVKHDLKWPDGKVTMEEYGRAYIPATVFDNPFIVQNNRQYIVQLMEQPEPRRSALLYGKWDAFDGQFFKEWDPKSHVIDPFPIPKEWRRSFAFDWGYAKDYTAILWFAEDPRTGQIYCYREIYIKGVLDEDVAKMILEETGGEDIHAVYYPWDLDNKSGQTGQSMRERMDAVWMRAGKFWYQQSGNRDRTNGWAATRYLLGIRPDGEPRMKVFSTCKNLIRTIPDQVHDETHVEDLDTFGEDHAVDALRYFAATFRAMPEIMAPTRVERIYDVGTAVKIAKTGEFRMKFEERNNIKMAWMAE